MKVGTSKDRTEPHQANEPPNHNALDRPIRELSAPITLVATGGPAGGSCGRGPFGASQHDPTPSAPGTAVPVPKALTDSPTEARHDQGLIGPGG